MAAVDNSDGPQQATMAKQLSVDDNTIMENKFQSTSEVSAGECGSQENELGVLQFQASEVISRLEQATEKNADGGYTWNNPSGFLSQAKTPEEILTSIQDLIIHEDAPQIVEDGTTETLTSQITRLPLLTPSAKLALTAHTISAYAVALPRSHAQRLAGRLAADTTRWLSHVFRFIDCASSFHEDYLEGLVRITRLVLHRKYPRYMEEGFVALSSCPPIIYTSVAAPSGLVQQLCRQLSLPLNCVRAIPQNTILSRSRCTIDVSALERRIAEDAQSNNVTPLLVIAEAGSVLTGHCDNISRLRAICDKYNVWLHLRGHSLAALALNDKEKYWPSKVADSITLPLGVWLGIPSLPVVTLYRLSEVKGSHPSARDTTLSLASGLMTDSLSRRLPTLPLWTALQALGRNGIQERFKDCFIAVEELYDRMKKFPCIRILSQIPGGETGCSLKDVLTNSQNIGQIFEIVASALVFQFVPPDRDLESTERVMPYYDKLNSWLTQILQRDIDNVQIELREMEQHGLVIRICPLENSEPPPNREDIENLIACLEQQIEILLATVQHKETFVRLVSENNALQLVDIPSWAGLGGVRYVPTTWIHVMTDQAKEELNKLNTQLVETLRNTDAAFSLGEGTDGLACVRFAMVTQDTDVAELLSLVLQVGQEVEASFKLLDSISEVLKRGIEAAQTDLERENAEKLWQEGILRHVPVVGTFVNWWSPPSKETGVRGRSLNLEAGVVESTENIYKYHMQLQPNATNSNGSGARTPPQPLVQTPVGTGSQSHSRSSSHSSLQSGKSITVLPTVISHSQIKNESNELKSS